LEHWADIRSSVTDHLQEAQEKSQIQLNKVISNIEHLWIKINDLYAYLQCDSHTHRAVARLLHLEIEVLNEMYHEGVLDEGEKSRLLHQVEHKLANLHFSRHSLYWKVKTKIDYSEDLMKNSLLMHRFIQRDVNHSHRKDIFEILSLR